MKTEKLQSQMRRSLCLGAVAAALFAGPLAAQDSYPDHPVRLYAPSAGGSGDWAARLLAEHMQQKLGEPLLVENRANLVGIELTAEAEPDGYTLLFYGSGLYMFPMLQPEVAKYDTLTDLYPITSVAGSPSILAVHPSVEARTVEELIAYAKENPGKLTYSAGQIGSANHLGGELFKSRAGDLDIVYVPYRGSGQAVTGAVAGEVQITFGTYDVLAPHIQSSMLIPLVVMAPERTPLAPDLRTAAEAGLDGAFAASQQILWAPAGVPQEILDKLNATAVEVLNDPAVKEAYLSRGLVAKSSTHDEMVALITSEMERGKLIAEEFKEELAKQE